MRKVTFKTALNLINGVECRDNNTEIRSFDSSYYGKSYTMRLFGNMIASKTGKGDIRVSMSGYNTVTTRERLNGILELCEKPYRFAQRNHKPVIVWMKDGKQQQKAISETATYSLDELDYMTARNA